jgi:hypothetical protein
VKYDQLTADEYVFRGISATVQFSYYIRTWYSVRFEKDLAIENKEKGRGGS